MVDLFTLYDEEILEAQSASNIFLLVLQASYLFSSKLKLLEVLVNSNSGYLLHISQNKKVKRHLTSTYTYKYFINTELYLIREKNNEFSFYSFY